MKKILLIILITLLTACNNQDGLFLEIDGTEYSVEDVIDSETRLLYKSNDQLNLDDYVILPLYEGETCFATSSKLYDSYYVYHNETLYSIIDAINASIITSDYFEHIEGFDCVSHEYVFEETIYNLLYEGEDYKIVVKRCYEVDEREKTVFHSTDSYELKSTDILLGQLKVIYFDEYYSIESALLLDIISIEQLIDADIEDIEIIEK